MNIFIYIYAGKTLLDIKLKIEKNEERMASACILPKVNWSIMGDVYVLKVSSKMEYLRLNIIYLQTVIFLVIKWVLLVY